MSIQLAQDIEIEGDLNCTSDLVFDGEMKGNINSKGSVVIGQNADITGNVRAERAVVEGSIDGSGEFASCRLTPSSVISGSVATATLQMEEGASLSGQCKIGKPKGAAAAAAPSRAPAASPAAAAQKAKV